MMRASLPLLCAISVACQSRQALLLASAEPRFHWPAPELFDTFIPVHDELQFRCEGTLALGPDRSFSLEYGRRGAFATEMEQKCTTDVLLDVVRWEEGWVSLRRDKDDNLHLDADLGSVVRPFDCPGKAVNPSGEIDEALIGAPDPRLATDGNLLVLFEAPWVHRYEDGAWTSFKLEVDQEGLIYSPCRALLIGRKLYLGLDKGEWGGRLIVVDMDTGRSESPCENWPNAPCNVRDLDRGPDGRVYATCGLAHMNSESSALMVLDGQVWKRELWSNVEEDGSSLRGRTRQRPDGTIEIVECTSDKWIAEIRGSVVPGANGTRIPSADFVALAFDELERPCVLTDILGLWRREPTGEWRWLTPGWPNWDANVSDLAIVDGKAVISSRAAGVIVVDLDTLAAERVRIR